MNKKEAVSYISDIPRFTTKNSLEHTREFLARLGDPERGRKILHVAGTNGKGSVCAYMQAILLAEGKTAGMFISPHLTEMNERIKINGSDISDEAFVRVFEKVKETVDRMVEEGTAHPTYFEFLFGMAMYAFAESGMEYIILETGIGGRLDATNAVRNPAVTVITSISLDHTGILGDTVEAIAGEKAGIIKPQVPVVFADGEGSTAVIEKAAEINGAPCIKISKNAYEILKTGEKHIDFSTVSAYDKYTTWELHNRGTYQAENAMLAIKAMECIFPEAPEEGLWEKALAEVTWPGRMEEILPGVFLDGAHNEGAIRAFAESVACRGEAHNVILFSAVEDKDYEKMIACLCENVKADCYIITKIQDMRGAPVQDIAAVFQRYTEAEVLTEEDASAAFEMALERKRSGGRVYCLGSLYLVGMLEELKGGRKDA